MASHFDCKNIAQGFLDWAERAREDLSFKPSLATVLFNPDKNPASLKYRDLVTRDAEKLGFGVGVHEPKSEGELISVIADLNADGKTTGIMIFYPLGTEMSDDDVMDLVSPHKDVEGLHSVNLGYLIKYKIFHDKSRSVKCVVPATAKGVVKTLLHHPEIRIEGAFVTIVNNSMRVGKPIGLMLENLGATVVKCYDKTPRKALEDCVRRADILVTAVPDPAFRIDADLIKPGAAVLDVSFEGNIDTAALENKAAFVTSPTNRLGRMTRAMMFVNLVYCAQQKEALQGADPRRLSV